MKNKSHIIYLFMFLTSPVVFSEERFKASFIVEYENKELRAEVQQSVYSLQFENISSNEMAAELDVYDNKKSVTLLPKGDYRYTLHTRLPHFRQSGSFKVDGDVLVTITHVVPKVINRKLVFQDQSGQPVVGINVRFSILGDANTHLVNHGDSSLHQGEEKTNENGEIEIKLAGQPPERFNLRIVDKSYSVFNKIFKSKFWDSSEPEVFRIEKLLYNGDINVSVSLSKGFLKLSEYIKARYPGRDHYAVLRLDGRGVDPALLNLTVREDKIPLFGLPDGEYAVKSMSVLVYGVNKSYNMRPADVESGTITVKDNHVVPSPRALRFSTEVPNASNESLDKTVASVEGEVLGRDALSPRTVVTFRYRFPEKGREEVRPVANTAPKSTRTIMTLQDGSFSIPFHQGDRFLIGSEFKDGYTYFHKYFTGDKQQSDILEIPLPERKKVELNTARITDFIVDDDQTSLLLIRDGVSDIAQTLPIKQNMVRIPLSLVPDVYTIHLIRFDPSTDVSKGVAAMNYSIVPVGKVTLDAVDKTIVLEKKPETQPLNLGVFFLELMKEWPGKRFIE